MSEKVCQKKRCHVMETPHHFTLKFQDKPHFLCISLFSLPSYIFFLFIYVGRSSWH